MFGPNASLDVNGSFHVSTADYLKLSDGGRFDATQPGNSVLTSAPPVAFGFLSEQPAGIAIQGSVLTTPHGKTLSIVGGDVNIAGVGFGGPLSQIFAPSGEINVVSVASAGEASFRKDGVNTESFQQFGEISVKDGGVLSVDGEGGGSVFIRGGQLVIENSFISASTHGDVDGGGIHIAVMGEVLINNGAQVSTATFGAGDGGTLAVEAGRIVLTGANEATGSATVLTTAQAPGKTGGGKGGDIRITTGSLEMSQGAQLTAQTSGVGDGGAIVVEAGRVVLTGANEATETPTMLSTVTSSDPREPGGKGGDIRITTGSLEMSDGAELFTVTAGLGDGGSIEVAADNITLSGANETLGIRTHLGAFSQLLNGKGGDIRITTDNMEMRGADLIAITIEKSQGDVGTIVIRANKNFRSQDSRVLTFSDVGNGGAIELLAGQTIELVRSVVTTQVFGGSGDAGNITIDPRYVILNNSNVIAQAVEGDGGNITINADVFLATPTSVVDASSQLGVSGTVDIRGVVSNISGLIAPLSQTYLSAMTLVEDWCAGRIREGTVSSFVVTGRDGAPLQPGGILPSPLYDEDKGGVRRGAVRERTSGTAEHLPTGTQIALDVECIRWQTGQVAP
jgi:large exoprotein involved in heme utilization and adhesion